MAYSVNYTTSNVPTSAGAYLFNCAAAGAGTFLLLQVQTGGGTFPLTSSDGITWTLGAGLDGATDLPVRAVIWDGAQFFAMSNDPFDEHSSWTSPDGDPWAGTPFVFNDTFSIRSVAYSGTAYVVVATEDVNVVYRSTDGGASFSSQSLPFFAGLSAVAWNGTNFCLICGNDAVGSGPSNKCATSPDGATWTQRSMPADRYWTGCASDGDRFVTVDGSGASDVCAVSTDNGLTWTEHTLPAAVEWADVRWNGTWFFAWAWDSEIFAFSADGETWESVSLPWMDVPGDYHDVAFIFSDGTYFVTVNNDGDDSYRFALVSGSFWTDFHNTAEIE